MILAVAQYLPEERIFFIVPTLGASFPLNASHCNFLKFVFMLK